METSWFCILASIAWNISKWRKIKLTKLSLVLFGTTIWLARSLEPRWRRPKAGCMCCTPPRSYGRSVCHTELRFCTQPTSVWSFSSWICALGKLSLNLVSIQLMPCTENKWFAHWSAQMQCKHSRFVMPKFKWLVQQSSCKATQQCELSVFVLFLHKPVSFWTSPKQDL